MPDKRFQAWRMMWIPDKKSREWQKKDVIPECLYQESKLFKDKNFCIPTSSSPRQSLSRF